MKLLFRTEHIPAVAKDMGQGPAEGTAWFELVLHEGPTDEKTSERCDDTVAYWRTQFARTPEPHRWTIPAAGAIVGVAPAVVPVEVLNGLPGDARISFRWNFAPSKAKGGARASEDRAT